MVLAESLLLLVMASYHRKMRGGFTVAIDLFPISI